MSILGLYLKRFKWWIIAWLFLSACLYPILSKAQRDSTKILPMKKWTNPTGMKFVYIPGGTFEMGDPRRGLDAFPVHTVTVSPFWIGQYEVTNEQFERFRKSHKRTKYSAGDSQPAIYVYWRDAAAFCKWLSKKDGHHYRLPTSAEWEYAARGGLEQKDYPWGNQSPDGRAAWGRLDTMPVGSYAPNGFDLYDMAGNVQEWVQDWYKEDAYSHHSQKNPKGPSTGLAKVTRGGGIGGWDLHVASISPCDIKLTAFEIGFRVVMEADNLHPPK